MSVEQKKKDLKWLKGRRLRDRDLYKNQVPKWYLWFSLWMIPLVLFAGVFIGSSQTVSIDAINKGYEIQDYKILFTDPGKDTEIKGNNGYTYKGSDTIYLNQDLLKEQDYVQVQETCHHELLHTIGVPEKHHDRINDFEKEITDPVCTQLVKKLVQ